MAAAKCNWSINIAVHVGIEMNVKKKGSWQRTVAGAIAVCTLIGMLYAGGKEVASWVFPTKVEANPPATVQQNIDQHVTGNVDQHGTTRNTRTARFAWISTSTTRST